MILILTFYILDIKCLVETIKTFLYTARPRDTRFLVPGKNQLKPVLHEVYIYVLNEIIFQKTVYLQGFCSKSVFHEVTPTY